MKYFMVEDIQNDDFYYCKAKNEMEAIIKAQRLWNSIDQYCEFIQVKVKEISEKEYKKYVSR